MGPNSNVIAFRYKYDQTQIYGHHFILSKHMINSTTILPQTYNSSISSQNYQQKQHQKKKYAKITDEIKQEFMNKITHENKSIRKAAFQTQINYSSAKAILSNHKAQRSKLFGLKKKKLRGFQKALYRTTDDDQAGPTSIICLLGGKILCEKENLKTKLIHKMTKMMPISSNETESFQSV